MLRRRSMVPTGRAGYSTSRRRSAPARMISRAHSSLGAGVSGMTWDTALTALSGGDRDVSGGDTATGTISSLRVSGASSNRHTLGIRAA